MNPHLPGGSEGNHKKSSRRADILKSIQIGISWIQSSHAVTAPYSCSA